MAWKDKVYGCFGVADGKFAWHASDMKAAKAMVKSAKEEGATCEEVEQALLNHVNKCVKNDVVRNNLIITQNKALKKIWALKRL